MKNEKGSCLGENVFFIAKSIFFYFNKRLLLLILYTLPMASMASEENPYSGIYKTNSENQTYVIIKKSKGRYFGQVSSGSVELIIDDKGGFKAKDINIDITGQFYDEIEGKYNKKTVNVFGITSVYYRSDIPKDKQVSAMYDSDTKMEKFTSIKIDTCKDTYNSPSENNDFKYIDDLIHKVESGRNYYSNIDSLLILKDNKLVVEQYFNGWEVDEPHTIQSVSKSLTSLLVGSAITENKIADINKTLPFFLPAYRKQLSGEKGSITLQNLLTMSAGLHWNEWATSYTDPENIRYKEILSSDSIAFTLERPLIEKPGTQFNYSGGFVSVVGEVIKEATSEAFVSDYAKNGLLSDLCFKNAYWLKQNDGRTNVAGGAFLRPRDMLKIGQLVLNDGDWNGKPIIDKAYLIESTKPVMNTNLTGKKYGYFWWHTNFVYNGKKYPAILAQGYGGQDIVIIKELNLVVVKTASNFNSMSLIGKIMRANILPTFAN